MTKLTAADIKNRLRGLEHQLDALRFYIPDYEGAPAYIQVKLIYYNTRLIQLSNSINRFRASIPPKFKYEGEGNQCS